MCSIVLACHIFLSIQNYSLSFDSTDVIILFLEEEKKVNEAFLSDVLRCNCDNHTVCKVAQDACNICEAILENIHLTKQNQLNHKTPT